MKRYLVVTALVLAFGALASARPAAAQQFWDGCEDDFTVWVPNSIGQKVSKDSALHINRPGCPWLIVDVDQGGGHKLTFTSEWSDPTSPSSPSLCIKAQQSYVVARRQSSGIYTIVGSGTVVGAWFQVFGSGTCYWQLRDGTRLTTVQSAAPTTYRLLVRAWNPWAERTARAVVWVDQPRVE